MVFGVTEAQIATAKEIFPSLFIQFGGSISESEIAQAIFENNFDNAIVTRSLERKLDLQKRRAEEQKSGKDKNSISDFFQSKTQPNQMVQSIVSDSSEGEELSRSYRSFFPSHEAQQVQDDTRTSAAPDAANNTILSVVSSSSLSVEDEEVDTVVMSEADETVGKETDYGELRTGEDSNGNDERNVEESYGVVDDLHSSTSVVSNAVRESVPASSCVVHESTPIASSCVVHESTPIASYTAHESIPTPSYAVNESVENSPHGNSPETFHIDDWSDGVSVDWNDEPHQMESLHSEESLFSEESSSKLDPPIISIDGSSLSYQHNSVDRSTTDLFTREESPPEECEVLSDSSSSESIDLNTTFYPEEAYSPTKTVSTRPPRDWKKRLEEASDEVEEIVDDSFNHSDLFHIDEASLLRLAHTKLPYFHSVRELQARKYEFPFDKLFKVSKRTKTVEQQETHPIKKRTYRKRSRSSKRHRHN